MTKNKTGLSEEFVDAAKGLLIDTTATIETELYVPQIELEKYSRKSLGIYTMNGKLKVLQETGKTNELKISEIPVPKIKSGHVLIKINAFGINRAEIFTRNGLSPSVEFPRVIGIECTGIIEDPSDSHFKKGDKVFTVSKRIEGKGIALDCLCEFHWEEQNTRNSLEIKVNTDKSVVPLGAKSRNCKGVACKTDVKNALGSILFVALTNNTNLKTLWQEKANLKKLEQLQHYLDDKTEGKEYALYDTDYLKHIGAKSNSQYIKYFEKNRIFDVETFKKHFPYENYSRDVSIILSEVDLRKEIPSNYNQNSQDFHRKGKKYEYSFSDLVIRYEYLYLLEKDNEKSIFDSNTITRIIYKNESEGTAMPISIPDGCEQYIALYGTKSAVFFWMGNFSEIALMPQAQYAQRLATSVFNNIKALKRFTKESIQVKRILSEAFKKWSKNSTSFDISLACNPIC